MGHLLINQGTESAVNFDLSGSINTQVIGMGYGTVSTVGTLPNIPGGTLNIVEFGTIVPLGGTVTQVSRLAQGSINVTNGTIGAGTINSATVVLNSGTLSVIPNVPGGTLGLVTRVGNVGTLEVGTISTLPNIPGGSIVVTAGTIAAHAVTAATITEGTLRNLISGTINAATAILNSGTINVATAVVSSLPNIPGGTVGLITRVGNVGTLEVGTISTLPNIPGGSITVTSGTVAISDGSNIPAVLNNPQDNLSNSTKVLTTAALLHGFDGLAWDRIRGDDTNGIQTYVTKGSINITAGTVNTGTINAATITAGTLNNVASGTINAATAILNSGTINVATAVITTGTVNAGTINTGTINAQKNTFSNVGTFTITAAALASSTSGVGRQSDLIDNSSNGYRSALIAARITTGSVTTANNLVNFYLIRSDGTLIRDDVAGTGDAAWTQKNAPLFGNILVNAVGTAVEYQAVFDTSPLGVLGPQWGIGIVHNLGNNLHATAGSHSISWRGIT